MASLYYKDTNDNIHEIQDKIARFYLSMLAMKQEQIEASIYNSPLPANKQVICSTPLQELEIKFDGGIPNYANQWSIIFTTQSSENGVTQIAFPIDDNNQSIIRWSIAEPIFDADKIYWLSFISLGNGSYLGVWSVIGEVNNE